MTPAATQQILSFPASKGYEWEFGWATLRLRDGDAGVPALQRWLNQLCARLSPDKTHITAFQFTIRRLAVVKQAAQQAIKPQALALAVLGALAALALIILMAQGLAQLLSRPAADAQTLRALGASRPEAAATAAGWGALAVAGAVLLSVAGAIAVSPLAPVGPVRAYDPARGFQADWLVLGGGGAVLLLILGLQLAWLAWRAVRQGRELPPAQGVRPGGRAQPRRAAGNHRYRDPPCAGARHGQAPGPGAGDAGWLDCRGDRPDCRAGVRREPERPDYAP